MNDKLVFNTDFELVFNTDFEVVCKRERERERAEAAPELGGKKEPKCVMAK